MRNLVNFIVLIIGAFIMILFAINVLLNVDTVGITYSIESYIAAIPATILGAAMFISGYVGLNMNISHSEL